MIVRVPCLLKKADLSCSVPNHGVVAESKNLLRCPTSREMSAAWHKEVSIVGTAGLGSSTTFVRFVHAVP
jgi:hypothetical protein